MKVQAVNIIQVRSKPKRRGMVRGRKASWKKAIVQLREGQSIEIFEGRRFSGPQAASAGAWAAITLRPGGVLSRPAYIARTLTASLPGLVLAARASSNVLEDHLMARKFKPTSPGRRHMTVSEFAEVTKAGPEKSLVEPMKKTGGRNNKGRITTRHRGGGHKRRCRVIDFKRTKDGVPARSPRSSTTRTGRPTSRSHLRGRREGLHPRPGPRLRVGSTVESGPAADIKPGNALPLANIPTGTLVHNVELKPGQGGKIARGAGTGIQLVGKDEGHGILRLPSGSFGECCSPVARRWGGSAMSTTRTSPRARQDALGGVESAPRCAARP